jgi:hypothetical protein
MRWDRAEKPKNKTVTIIDNRETKKEENMRTVLYVEARDIPVEQLQEMCKSISQMYQDTDANRHYIVPVRYGKIGSDVFFEQEWLDVVNKTCEIQDGRIVLKNGIEDVRVTREYIE